MKKVIVTGLFTIFIAAFISCGHDDNIPGIIDGTWHLINVSGGFAGIDDDYAKGEVLWTFNPINAVLTVDNKIGNNHGFHLPSGTYSYTIEKDDNGTQILYVDNKNYRLVILSISTRLTIWDGLVDGFTAEFKR